MGAQPPKKTSAQERLKQLSDQVVGGLKQLYKEHIKPVEALYKFGEFHSPLLEDSDFDMPPMVLCLAVLGRETSFIRYLLERDFPGQRIGPEPTTDPVCSRDEWESREGDARERCCHGLFQGRSEP